MLCLMSGTAGDRAVGTHKIGGYICATYCDMLVDKLVINPTYTSSRIMSKYRVADNMDTIPGVNFYQYDFSKVFADVNILNPSYNKWAKEPAKGEAYIKQTLGQLLAINSNGMIPSIREVIKEDVTGIMLFIPRTTATSKESVMNPIMSQINEIANEGYYVIELTGRTTTGENAELYVNGGYDNDTKQYVKGQITIAHELNKIPLIVSAGHIGSRSFSIAEINVVVLMYDGGSAATTGQNMSRGSTRGKRIDKTAHIISISVDPTRDDSMIQAVLETAVKVAEETAEDIIEATKRVLRSMNVHAMDSYGDMVPVNPDEYTAKIMNSNSLRKVVGATSKPQNIMDDAESIQKLLGMMGDQVSLGKAASIGKKGKTFAPDANGKVNIKNKDDSEEKDALALWNKIKAAMKLIADNAQNIAAIAGTDKLTTALDIIVNDIELTTLFNYSFNIESEFVKELVDAGTVNGTLLDLIVYTYTNEKSNEADDFKSEFV